MLITKVEKRLGLSKSNRRGKRCGGWSEYMGYAGRIGKSKKIFKKLYWLFVQETDSKYLYLFKNRFIIRNREGYKDEFGNYGTYVLKVMPHKIKVSIFHWGHKKDDVVLNISSKRWKEFYVSFKDIAPELYASNTDCPEFLENLKIKGFYL